jgi:two-component system OmpR family response regulator
MTATKIEPVKVLIIEDEGEMCLLLELLLNNKTTSLTHVKSLAAAKEFLQAEIPSIVLLDNRLPDGLGIDFLAFLKANYPTVKIIMITGADKAAKDIALENGADEFLNKPFTKVELSNSIQRLMN